jgi:hypothetical protein
LTRDPLTQEPVLPGEAAAIESLIARLRAMMAHEWAGTTMRRDAHTKMHGAFKAEFTVERDLPPELKVGLFATPATYRAWVRCSNSVNTIRPDGERDIRGMAIKLMGVPGRKILPGQEDGTTQDFIVISTDQFPIRDAAGFDALAAAFIGDLFDKAIYFTTHPGVTLRLLAAFRRFANPLQIRYFSCTPYAFGGAQVKYCATPHGRRPDRVPFDPPENSLRQAADRRLARGRFAVPQGRDAAHPGAGLRHRCAERGRREPVVHALALPACAHAARRAEPRAAHHLRGAVDLPPREQPRAAARTRRLGGVRWARPRRPPTRRRCTRRSPPARRSSITNGAPRSACSKPNR